MRARAVIDGNRGTMDKLHALLDKMRAEVPSFLSSEVVHIDSGIPIASHAIDPSFDGTVASASFAELVRATASALDLLGIGAQATEDILITTGDAYIVLRVIGHEHYQGLAIQRDGTLGFARMVMKKYEPLLLAAIASMSTLSDEPV